MKKYAKRIDEIEPFRVVEILTKAKLMESQGREVFHLEAGEPDFSTVEPIISGAKVALDNGKTSYSQATGLPELKQAISDYYASDYGLTIDPKRILITPGASGALLLTAAFLLEAGQNLLMADPGYPCNRHFLRLVEGRAVLVPVNADEHYQLLANKAQQYWQEDTAGILVASPANPTGEILTQQQLVDLHALVEKKQGCLVVDEIYHGLTYGVSAPSALSVSDDIFVINSFSKYFGMTGWRLGWMVAPEWAIEGLEKLAQNLFISMSTFSQYGALEAFKPQTRALLNERRDIFAKRRDFLLPALREIGFSIPHTPAGALYLYANASRFTDDSEQFCVDLLEQHGIALTPGADFGRYKAKEHLRFAYTTSYENLEKAVEKLHRILK